MAPSCGRGISLPSRGDTEAERVPLPGGLDRGHRAEEVSLTGKWERGGARDQRVLVPNSRPFPPPWLTVGSPCASASLCAEWRDPTHQGACQGGKLRPAQWGPHCGPRVNAELCTGLSVQVQRREEGGGINSLPLCTSDWLPASQTHSRLVSSSFQTHKPT